jgi:Chaperone of endosialidase
MTKVYLLFIAIFGSALSKAQVAINITGALPASSSMLDVSSTSRGILIPQISIDSLKDVTSIASPANGLIVYNTVQPGVRNDMARGYYWYSTNALTWVKFADNLTDNVWKNGGLLGIQLRDTTDGVEMMDGYTGTSFNYNPKVKILKKIDSALLNAKNNITALVVTGVNRKTVSGWEPFQKTSIIFEMNYLNSIDGTSGTANNVAISSYIDRIGTTATTQTQGLAFYVTAPPQNTATADTPSLAMFRHNVGVGAYPTDINNVTEGRVQITGFSNGDQLSLRHPSSINLKWGLYVSAIDSSLNFYSNGSLRANIDRVTGVYSALSDRNLKKNIAPLQPVLDNINKLTPYIYNYTDNKDSDRKSIGFMAQDVEPYFPDLVFRKKERETGEPFMMMSYQSFGVIAIKAIQEQQVIIKSQEQRIQTLEDEMKRVKEAVGIKN